MATTPFHRLNLGDKLRRIASDTEALNHADLNGTVDTLGELATEADEMVADLLRLAALVSNAALKHTVAGKDDPSRDRQGVGRMHNAAKLARTVLDTRCPSCADAKAHGLNAADRDGVECGDCTRLLGNLGDTTQRDEGQQ